VVLGDLRVFRLGLVGLVCLEDLAVLEGLQVFHSDLLDLVVPLVLWSHVHLEHLVYLARLVALYLLAVQDCPGDLVVLAVPDHPVDLGYLEDQSLLEDLAVLKVLVVLVVQLDLLVLVVLDLAESWSAIRLAYILRNPIPYILYCHQNLYLYCRFLYRRLIL